MSESQKKYKTFYENCMDAILITSQEGIIYSANKAACEMLGWGEKDLIRIGRNGIVHQTPQLANAIKIRKKTGKYFGELLFKRKDGSIFPVEISSSVFNSEGKEFTVIIARDISERINTEKALRLSEERLRLAGKATGFGTYSYDFEKGTAYFSDEFYTLYGMNPRMDNLNEDVLHKAAFPDDVPGIIASMRAANDPQGSGVLDIEFRIFLPDKSIRWLKARGLTTFSEGTTEVKPLISNGIMQDITYHKKIEEELINSKKLLEDLNQHLIEVREHERSEIALNIHDDLGQRLTALDIDVAWLKSRVGVQSPAVIKKFKDINRMINETIDGLKEISSFLRPSILYDFGLIAAFEWQLSKFGKLSKIKHNFKYSLGDAKLDDRISLALFRVLQESLTNVVRHSEASQVNINLSSYKRKVRLTIQDNGIGMNEMRRNSLNSMGITGIKERITAMNGEVVIKSKKNKGTVIFVQVPIYTS